MALGIPHPFTGALHEQHEGPDGEMLIKVTTSDGAQSGIFTPEGKHVSGELRECDPQLCGWVAGPIMANHRMSEAAPDR